MSKTTHYLNDEHMQLYEWSGTVTGIAGVTPAKSKRTHSWHASYSVLAVMTSLLILNGCNKAPAVRGDEQAAHEMREKPDPLYDTASAMPSPAQEAENAPDPARETP